MCLCLTSIITLRVTQITKKRKKLTNVEQFYYNDNEEQNNIKLWKIIDNDQTNIVEKQPFSIVCK